MTTETPSETPAETPTESPAAASLPSEEERPAPTGGVLIIGDSVTLGARTNLTNTIPDCTVDATGSRQIWQGYNLLMDLQRRGRVPEYVVIALGTNGNANAPAKIEQIIADVQSGTRLIFMTPFDGRANSTWHSYRTMEYMRTLPEIYPFVTIADWAAIIEPESRLLGSDRIHIGGNRTAINMYTNCIIDAINTASGKPAKQ